MKKIARIWRSRTKLTHTLRDGAEFIDRIGIIVGGEVIIQKLQEEPFVAVITDGTEAQIKRLRDEGYFVEDPVMYVEDDPNWREDVQNALEHEYDLVVFDNLTEAKQAYSTGRYSVVICDGALQKDSDGKIWAKELHATGQPVILLSTSPDSTVPSLDKAEFSSKKLQELLRIVYCRIEQLTKELDSFGEWFVKAGHDKIFDWVVRFSQVAVSLGDGETVIQNLRSSVKKKFKEINEGAPPELQVAFMTSIPSDKAGVINSTMAWIAKAEVK